MHTRLSVPPNIINKTYHGMPNHRYEHRHSLLTRNHRCHLPEPVCKARQQLQLDVTTLKAGIVGDMTGHRHRRR